MPQGIPPADHAAAVALLKERKRRLDVADHVHERASATLKAEGVPGMDEQRTFNDWVNDVLAARDRAMFKLASEDPAKAYLGYVSERVADPYHVSYRAVNQLAKQVAEDEVNTFVHVRWHQELAWGRRLRAGTDDRVAVLAQLFLRAAAKDPCKVFIELAAGWGSALDDIRFATAAEHDLSESAIRSSSGDVAYRPAFLRLYEIKHGPSLDRMNDPQLAAAAAQARAAEEAERRGDLCAPAVLAARRTPLCRILGVLDVAVETGRSSDALVRDEGRFLAELARGRLPKVVRGLPYSEFVAWLQATLPGEEPEPVAIGDEEHAAMVQILSMPLSWLAQLPDAFRGLGAMDVEVFRSWAAPLAAGTARIPRDAVADYGLHLVRLGYRRSAA